MIHLNIGGGKPCAGHKIDTASVSSTINGRDNKYAILGIVLEIGSVEMYKIIAFHR